MIIIISLPYPLSRLKYFYSQHDLNLVNSDILLNLSNGVILFLENGFSVPENKGQGNSN